MAKQPPPKRSMGNIIEQDTQEYIDNVLKEINDLALKICREGALTASGRTTIETHRSTMINTSDNAITHYPPSPYTSERNTEIILTNYIGYWIGELRALYMMWCKNRTFNKTAWEQATKIIPVMASVSIKGINGVYRIFNEKRQQYIVGVNNAV